MLIVGLGAYVRDRSSSQADKIEYPQYLNFSGNYVFSIPKTYSVDEQSVPGAQLIYSGTIQAKTVEDVYNQNGISVREISDLADHSAKGFNDYVNNTFIPDLKKTLSTNDVQTKFGKASGTDNASITVNKDGKAIRFVYLKGGKHAAVVLAKSQNDAIKTIDGTIIDTETSTLKNEAEPIKKAIQNVAQLVKAQKAPDLYKSASPDLRAKNTQDELTKALQTALPYTSGDITISGGSYRPGEFSSAIRFTTLDKTNQQTVFGSIVLKKIDGQWKLQALSLPTPKQ